MLSINQLKITCPVCKTRYIIDFSKGGYSDNSDEEVFCEKDGTSIWKGLSYGHPDVLIDYDNKKKEQ